MGLLGRRGRRGRSLNAVVLLDLRSESWGRNNHRLHVVYRLHCCPLPGPRRMKRVTVKTFCLLLTATDVSRGKLLLRHLYRSSQRTATIAIIGDFTPFTL